MRYTSEASEFALILAVLVVGTWTISSGSISEAFELQLISVAGGLAVLTLLLQLVERVTSTKESDSSPD